MSSMPSLGPVGPVRLVGPVRPVGRVGRARRAFAAALVALCAAGASAATVDDLVARMPAAGKAEGLRLAAELVKLGPDAVKAIAAKLVPPTQGGDLKERLALHGLALTVARPGAEADRKMVAGALVPAMQAAKGREVKAFLIRQLQLCGKDEAVPPLARLLTSADLYEPAAQALTRIRTPKAIEAMVRALPGAKPPLRLTLIRALGSLRAKAAAPEIRKHAASPDRTLRLLALYALANIGDAASTDLLAKAADAKSPYERGKATTHLLLLARRMAEAGDTAACARICRALITARTAPRERHVVCAALKTLVDGVGEAAFDDLVKATEHPDKQVRAAALAMAEAIPGKAMTARWVARLDGAEPAAKADILGVLARRGDPTARPAVLAALKENEKAVRLAAIPAVAQLGGTEALSALLGVLGGGEADEAKAVQAALMRVGGDGLVKAAAAALPKVPAASRVVLLEMLAARKATGQAPAALAAARDASPDVRLAALKALAEIADGAALPQLTGLLLAAKSGRERGAAQRAVVAAAERVPDPERRAEALLAALGTARGKPRATLLQTLARVGGSKALAAVATDTKNADPATQDAAVRALAEWHDATAAPELLRLVRGAKELKHQVLALRGYARLVAEAEAPAAQRVKMLTDAMAAARRPEEKRLVLAGLSGVGGREALAAVAAHLGDATLGAEAAIAVVKIARTPGPDGQPLLGADVVAALKKVVATAKDANTRKLAQATLNTIPKPDALNIARGKPVRASVRQQGNHAPPKAVDGNTTDKTNSAWFGARWPCWFQVDLQKPETIDSAHVWWYWDSRYFQYKLEVSPDAKTWQTVVDASKNRTPATERGTIHNFKPVQARYVRLQILKNSANEAVHLVELKIYRSGTGPKATTKGGATGTVPLKKGDSPPAKPDKEGFVPLFNGTDLTGWVGSVKGYVVENGVLVCKKRGGGHLFTEREYADFVLRFEFKLEPGANNGLGIRTPLRGNPAYAGMELQILDNSSPRYAKLQPYQFHGSIYGVVPAKRGHLKPVGEWNAQEVTARGTKIKVVLNGTAIVDADLAPIIKSGETADRRGVKGHPGLLRPAGHIGFLGHGARIEFRSIRIKELK